MVTIQRNTQRAGGVAAPKGFTLIELLVVVSIIALLIAILLPSLGKARERSRLAVCQTHLRAWGQGFHIYAATYDNSLPLDGASDSESTPIGRWDDNSLWFNAIPMLVNSVSYNELQLGQTTPHTGLPKAGSNSLYVCPNAYTVAIGKSPEAVNNGYFQTVGWDANYATSTRDMLLCYGINSQLRAFNYVAGAGYPGTQAAGDISKLSALEPPANVVLMAEKRVDPTELNVFTDAELLAWGGIKRNQTLTQNKVAPKRLASRHSKGGNIAFADAHVEWVAFKLANAANSATPVYNQPGVLMWSGQ